ncbi:MAG: cob(I)yrinic acid a,c-diamide adenosyltransferase, partial [Vallitaleaceae bacterium]|nr:cob(I)yrinic acid a,c-diamide adenosyltransferase [Vallitaleaceae bacterium]
MRIYTKKGDSGLTDTLSGNRVHKNDPRIHLLGCVDELSTYLGNAKLLLKELEQKEISDIQQKLIQIMGSISSGFEKNIALSEDCISFEAQIDEFSQMYPPLSGFVIPGECEAASRMDLARTAARRAERELVGMKSHYRIPADYYSYFNRLSDYLFAWARRLEFREKIQQLLEEEQKENGEAQNNRKDILEINRLLAKE